MRRGSSELPIAWPCLYSTSGGGLSNWDSQPYLDLSESCEYLSRLAVARLRAAERPGDAQCPQSAQARLTAGRAAQRGCLMDAGCSTLPNARCAARRSRMLDALLDAPECSTLDARRSTLDARRSTLDALNGMAADWASTAIERLSVVFLSKTATYRGALPPKTPSDPPFSTGTHRFAPATCWARAARASFER